MKQLKRACIAALPLALCGCLEVNQHPAWLKGGYAGKIDQLPYQQLFHRDRLAWFATISNRNLHQNEYVRAKPPGTVGAKRLQDIGATIAQNTGMAAGVAPGAGQPAVDLAATRTTTPAVAYSPAAMPAAAAGTPAAPVPGAMATPAPGATAVPVPGATAVPAAGATAVQPGTAQPQPGTVSPAAAGTAPRPATR